MGDLTYLFAKLTYPGFGGQEYSYFKVVTGIGNIVALNICVPIVCGRYHMHDAMLLTIVYWVTAVGLLTTAYTTELWQFYLAQSLNFFYVCSFSAARFVLKLPNPANSVII